jgi:hypothetical protein
MTVNSFRMAFVVVSIALTSAVVSAQSQPQLPGNAPGIMPEPGLPSQQTPSALTHVSFEQRLNEQLPLDLPFKDEAGRAVKLGEFFGR